MGAKNKKNILIAGVGGASLGTEIFKSLKLAGKYNIFGADISPYAFGLYQEGFKKTFVIDGNNYINSLFDVCGKAEINAIVPGAEKTLALISSQKELFSKKNICLVINSDEVIRLCADKIKTFDFLRKKRIPIPLTKEVKSEKDLYGFVYPCVIKPSTESGGSRLLYIAENQNEAKMFIGYLGRSKTKAIIQEYIPADKGEYTVGILSLPNAKMVGSIALKRLFDAKLSVSMESKDWVVSSGYSQGIIDDFWKIREQAEVISKALGSRGPLNIQGRFRNNIFYPFEINPRISASTYLRALAGFNEIDIYLQFLFNHKEHCVRKIKYGCYLRSLNEEFVKFKDLKNHG